MTRQSRWFAAALCAGLCAAVPARAEDPEPKSAGEATTSAPAAATSTAKAEEDDWDDSSGPVDRSIHLSGVLMTSVRGTLFNGHLLPDQTPVPDSVTFQIEHVHMKFSGDLTKNLSWEVMPCFMHMNSFSVVTANVSYQFGSLLTLTAGRFLVPFGQFNVRSLPGQYLTVSRPLLYQGHEDDMIQFTGATPNNFLFTPRDDTGLEAFGSVFFGKADVFQASYSAYVTNGFRAVSDTMARFWDDNNVAKQFGGRVSLAYNGPVLAASAAASGFTNKYEANLLQQAWAVDGLITVTFRPQQHIHLRGEYVDTVREIQPTDALLKGTEGIRGFYVTLDAELTGWLAVYYQYDYLSNREPVAQLDETFHDQVLTTTRHIAGVRATIGGLVDVKLEYGRWIEPSGVPSANRLSLQLVVIY